MLHNPDDVVFINYDLGNGKKVEVHYPALFEQEFEINIHITKLLVNKGIENIRLMPKIHEKDKVNRERYFGKHYTDKFPKTCPDAIINGISAEYKSTNLEKLITRLNEASKQAEMAVIEINDIKFNTDTINRINNKIKKHRNNKLKTILITIEEEIFVIRKS